MESLAAAWMDSDGDFPGGERGMEAGRLALLGHPPPGLLDKAVTAIGATMFHRHYDAKSAHAIFLAGLGRLIRAGAEPSLSFINFAADCAESLGDTPTRLDLLRRGVAAKSDDRIRQAQLRAKLAVATLGETGPHAALDTLNQAAEIFIDEGDRRGHAVTLGHIADILAQRGQLDEALRIHRDVRLPVCVELGDIRGHAATLHDCAQIRLIRDGLTKDNAHTIVDELAESFARFLKFQRVDAIGPVGEVLGQVMAAVGLHDKALTVLDQAAQA